MDRELITGGGLLADPKSQPPGYPWVHPGVWILPSLAGTQCCEVFPCACVSGFLQRSCRRASDLSRSGFVLFSYFHGLTKSPC